MRSRPGRRQPAGGRTTGPSATAARVRSAGQEDKAYDFWAVRRELRRRRLLPVIIRKGAPDIKGLDKLRCVVE
ncbi:hypothetical protein ACFYO2_47860 [Streptomyces sp. NPDC006602]|uniref:hypothetical protein n=1 Tax=Streptomyces sp. NPDC006602 TaxID=3364751 RepID=UPI0036BC9652